MTIPVDEAKSAVERFLAADSVSVERMTKKGLREFDCRAAVVSLTVSPHERGARLDLVLRHTVPAVRPDDVLTGLAAVSGLPAGRVPAADPARAGAAGRGERRHRRPAARFGIGPFRVTVCDTRRG